MYYQEQAICLFQAMEDEINLVPDKDPLEMAKRLIRLSLDICRDQAVRNYPSALNRAGRIFGQKTPMSASATFRTASTRHAGCPTDGSCSPTSSSMSSYATGPG